MCECPFLYQCEKEIGAKGGLTQTCKDASCSSLYVSPLKAQATRLRGYCIAGISENRNKLAIQKPAKKEKEDGSGVELLEIL